MVSKEDYYAIRTCYILEEELFNRNKRWLALPAPMPLASRIMIRLEELCPGWRLEATRLLQSESSLTYGVTKTH